MKFFTGILFGFFLTGLIVAGYLATGSYDVSAAQRPSKMEARLATFALNKSVAKRAPKINPDTAVRSTLRCQIAAPTNAHNTAVVTA